LELFGAYFNNPGLPTYTAYAGMAGVLRHYAVAPFLAKTFKTKGFKRLTSP